MIAYKDMIFCKAYKDCKSGDKCDRALTTQVVEDAKEWWGGDDAPIAITDKLTCFKEI